MKKLVLSALVMSALFFASCGGGTAEYKDTVKAMDEYEKDLGKVKSCDDLSKVREKDYGDAKKEYGEKEKMTPEEEDKIIIRNAELSVKARKLCRKYQCDWCKSQWKKD